MLEWATDLWPYVNGKALMSNLRLKTMEASEMLDVIHFMFEEDSHIVSEESLASRSGVRVSLYREFYGVQYKYEYKPKKQSPGSRTGGQHVTEFDEADVAYLGDSKPFNPKKVDAPYGMSPSNPLEPMKPPAQPLTEFDPYSPDPFKGRLAPPMN